MTKTKKKNKFPHIFRFIPAKTDLKPFFYQGFLKLLWLGVLFLLFLNLYSSWRQPEYLKNLQKNPTDIVSIKSVLLQNQQPELDRLLKKYLQSINANNELETIEQEQNQQRQKIIELNQLLVKYPQYPDGHAYLAVLYYQQGQCLLALESIDKAIVLDPNRLVFEELKQTINQCLP